MATVSGVPFIGGITFDFTESGYLAPTWSGTLYSFGEAVFLDCYSVWLETNTSQWTEVNTDQWNICFFDILHQIWSDMDYVYAAITFGLDIIEMESELKVAYIEQHMGFSTVWANDDRVYLGTSTSGIKYFEKTCISGSLVIPIDMVLCLIDYASPHGASSETVRYIHGSGDDYLMCCTNSGVDVYHMKPTMYRSTHATTDAYKCFMTSTGKFYYTTNVDGQWAVNRVDNPLWDWTTPDYIHAAGGIILASGIAINDIFVTEGTSPYDNTSNTLFVATSSGAYVIDEGDFRYAVYYT